jgi:hypothetical protein
LLLGCFSGVGRRLHGVWLSLRNFIMAAAFGCHGAPRAAQLFVRFSHNAHGNVFASANMDA